MKFHIDIVHRGLYLEISSCNARYAIENGPIEFAQLNYYVFRFPKLPCEIADYGDYWSRGILLMIAQDFSSPLRWSRLIFIAIDLVAIDFQSPPFLSYIIITNTPKIFVRAKYFLLWEIIASVFHLWEKLIASVFWFSMNQVEDCVVLLRCENEIGKEIASCSDYRTNDITRVYMAQMICAAIYRFQEEADKVLKMRNSLMNVIVAIPRLEIWQSNTDVLVKL